MAIWAMPSEWFAVATTGACDEVVSGMHRLADGTGGRLIEQSRLQDPSSIGLGVAIQNRVASLMPRCFHLTASGQRRFGCMQWY